MGNPSCSPSASASRSAIAAETSAKAIAVPCAVTRESRSFIVPAAEPTTVRQPVLSY